MCRGKILWGSICNENCKIRKTLAILTFAFAVFFAFGISATAAAGDASVVEAPEVRVVIDGVTGVYTDVALEINGRILLPFREVLTRLGVPNDDGHIAWNDDEQSVTVRKDSDVIKLTVGNKNMSLNGVGKEFDVAPYFYEKNDRTYVPVRAVSELLDKYILWEESTSTVYIRDKANYAETLKLLEKMQAVESSPIVRAESESQMNISVRADGMDLPGADANGALRITVDATQHITTDTNSGTSHIKQIMELEGIKIGTELFVQNKKVYMKVEGPDAKWTDVSEQSAFDMEATLEQTNILESQMGVRDLSDVAMALAINNNADGTYMLIGEPIQLTDVNTILDSLSGILPLDDYSGLKMSIDAFHIGTVVSSDYKPLKAAVNAVMNMAITEDAGTSKAVTMYFTIDMNMSVNYEQTAPDFKIAIPEGLADLL